MKLTVGTATGNGVIVDSNDQVVVLELHARSNNEHSVYVGTSGVSETSGRELPPGESMTWNFALPTPRDHAGYILFSKIYAIVRSGDGLDYSAIIRGD